jgi:hypothetical protein
MTELTYFDCTKRTLCFKMFLYGNKVRTKIFLHVPELQIMFFGEWKQKLIVSWFVILFIRIDCVVTVSVNCIRRKIMQITVSVLPTSAVKITTQHNHLTKAQMEYLTYVRQILKKYFSAEQVNKWTKFVYSRTAILTVRWCFSLGWLICLYNLL